MLSLAKWVDAKILHYFITKELFNLITDLLLTCVKTVCQSSDKGFAEFCKQRCTTLTMMLQNFVNSLLVVKERGNMKWISSRQDEIHMV